MLSKSIRQVGHSSTSVSACLSSLYTDDAAQEISQLIHL